MGRTIIMHIDDAPWIQGGPTTKTGYQMIGEEDEGQHVVIPSFSPHQHVAPHTHSQDEVIYILEGGLTLGDRTCGPGTFIFIEGNTEYEFTAGDQGLRFLNVRPGPSDTKFTGK